MQQPTTPITPSSPADDRSIGQILRDLLQDLGRIVRDEVQLAKAEFTEKAARMKTAGGAIATAAITGLLCLLCIVTACIAALALVMPVWLSALIMSVLLGAVAGLAFSRGARKWKNVDLRPHQTITTLKDDVDWARQHAPGH
jgi:uncharacterized membrane protein